MTTPDPVASPAVNILVIGKDPDILKVVLRLLNDFKEARYHAAGTTDPDEARRLLAQTDIDLVLITNGLDAAADADLRGYISIQRPGIPVVQHFGGGSGLLFNEIRHTLLKQQH
jgi:DNA-binding NtrC family response regulator